jgi:hypothetical protein
MQRRWIMIACGVVALAGGSSCKSTDCGDGTIERDGTCVPADEVVGTAACGPFTELQGDRCVPMFPPTECDPATTVPDTDPATGVTTCIGTGTIAGCTGAFACPAPAAGTQTICGQLYDFENNALFQGTNPTGMQCPATPTADGPCSLGIRAYDAVEFAMGPATATPRTTGAVYIDDCGRYRVPDIDPGTSPFIGLGIDDADPTKRGPMGTSNAVGVATAKMPDTRTTNFEAFVVKPATTSKWAMSGGPTLATGMYAMVFRAASTGMATQAGVTIVKTAGPVMANDFYFQAAQQTRETIDVAQNTTGVNGTGLVTGASLADGGYSGVGGLPPTCKWSGHPGVTLQGIVFIQILRPVNAAGMTCPL